MCINNMFRVFESIAPLALNAVPLATFQTFLRPRRSFVFWAFVHVSFVSLKRKLKMAQLGIMRQYVAM